MPIRLVSCAQHGRVVAYTFRLLPERGSQQAGSCLQVLRDVGEQQVCHPDEAPQEHVR